MIRRSSTFHPRQRGQKGAALLLAMLTVALVATLAAAATWQQWRAIEIESAERQRIQASWILGGALDWSRLILREDARANRNGGNADHLGEPWATPLEEARLSSFLAVDRENNADTGDDVMEAFLSGEIQDAQSKLNFANVISSPQGNGSDGSGSNLRNVVSGVINGAAAPASGASGSANRASSASATTRASLSTEDLAAFSRLFAQLGLPEAELKLAADNLLESTLKADEDLKPSATPLIPTRYAQLGWLGLSESTLKALEPYVTLLPERTKVNLNTAAPMVLSAAIEGLDVALAQYVVAQREVTPLGSVDDLKRLAPTLDGEALDSSRLDVRSRYFEVRGRLRLDNTIIEERSLVARRGMFMKVIWRERMKGG